MGVAFSERGRENVMLQGGGRGVAMADAGWWSSRSSLGWSGLVSPRATAANAAGRGSLRRWTSDARQAAEFLHTTAMSMETVQAWGEEEEEAEQAAAIISHASSLPCPSPSPLDHHGHDPTTHVHAPPAVAALQKFSAGC